MICSEAAKLLQLIVVANGLELTPKRKGKIAIKNKMRGMGFLGDLLFLGVHSFEPRGLFFSEEKGLEPTKALSHRMSDRGLKSCPFDQTVVPPQLEI